jgi:hypothetical protein
MRDIGDWASQEVRSIQMAQGISSEPICLEVRKFMPRDGDVCDRHWVDHQVKKSKPLEPYALADVEKTAAEFKEYIWNNAVTAMKENLALQKSDPLIQETYGWAIRHYQDVSADMRVSPDRQPSWSF